MTRENKVKDKKERALKRRQKRIDELNSIKSTMMLYDIDFSRARNKVRRNGHFFQCEMGYGDCEERGYCNGDC